MAKKYSETLKLYQNPNGPTIGDTARGVITEGDLTFKNIDGSGKVSTVNDWRKSSKERAEAYTKVLSLKEKIALLFISDWRMGPKYPYKMIPGYVPTPDESGLLDDGEVNGKTIFGEQHLPGTTTLIKEWLNRHLIVRDNAKAEDLADWLNQLNAVAEECEHFIPVEVASNSRNENGEVVFGMNDAVGVFATYPGTLGIAAAVKGTGDLSIVDKFADTIKREWNTAGLKKGYMYMADTVTDPRWQRTFGTFGEDPALIIEIFEHLIPGVQGSKDGVTKDGVAMTMKHFPGGGARENGFDPHYAAGQWNVYQTESSLAKYHMCTFTPAIKYNVSSIMPYYSKPAAAKSAKQVDLQGNEIRLDPYGFAYNKLFIDDILRKQMGFKGYINSDTGIVHNMCWGVDMLDVPERIGYAVTQSGVDLISGLFDNEAGMQAYERATNGYYDTHEVPQGFKKEDLVLTDESIDRACARSLTEMFELGMFDNPYADAQKAKEMMEVKEDWDAAALTHRQSVVLLKNNDVLPLTEDKLAGKKVYAEAFNKDAKQGEAATKALREMLTGVTLVEDPKEADYAILMVSPSSGNYFSATAGYLELDICEDKDVPNVDEQGRPLEETHKETTLSGQKRIKDIADAVHANGGKVVSNVNFPLAWMVGNVEKFSDALTAGFDTFPSATLDVMFGKFAPVGKLPLSLPKDDSVLAVNRDGVCVSPNDVPGYVKDQFMPEDMKDENGKAYAYKDANGNYYEYGFGLKF